MSILPETPEPAVIRHDVDGTMVEVVREPEGGWLYRCPEIFPVNARHWRGPFEDEAAALTDFAIKSRIPRITPEQLRRLKAQGHHSMLDGDEVILYLDPLTGVTVLTSFEIETD